MRRLLVPASAVCVALLAVACGGTGRPGQTFSVPVATGPSTVRTLTVPSRRIPAPPSAAEIERAATLTAARPGFTAKVSARITLPQLSGRAVTAVGDGHFDPRTGSGTLDLAVGLPGLLSLAGPLPTQVRLVGGTAYVEVPSELAGQLGSSEHWLEDGIAVLGLGDSLSPPDILREVARDATRRVPGQRARVTIDPQSGLVRAIVLHYAVAGGYRVHVRLRLTGFGAQSATAPPPPGSTGELQSAVRALGF